MLHQNTMLIHAGLARRTHVFVSNTWLSDNLAVLLNLARACWRQGLEYRYSYGVAAKPPCTFANGLGKFDMVKGEAKLWHEPGCIPGEPVIMPRPGAQVLFHAPACHPPL